ncbi:putative Werner syndrome helicase [Metarhizium acridum CQMa 102]|uniref:Putative Werner syndrome helicase n=1 Tax=Metarhizium acridum (strain CQMa 102) TaxID=655827 RepID=E9E7T2_METAQ|nr:putative Werner syndrome helicase [Metarhizium acridum CQMa 102]EFY88066.1 putative Werner syndrome helicase [Metarhizium acridum CQMa 102]
MARPLRVAGEKRLWCPKLGIRFSTSSNSVPLYPPLDMPRFVQTASEGNGIRSDFRNDPFDYCANAVMEQDLATLATPSHDAITQQSKNSAPTNPQTPPQGPTTTIHRESEKLLGTEISKPHPEGDPAIVEAPSTPLSFNISPSLFHAARAAKAGSFESFWSHTMYQRISDQGAIEKVKVHYCTSKHTTEQVCRKHFLGEAVLGLDLEWFPYASRSSGPRDNVSLIQIASPGRIGLFHVAMFAEGEDDLVAPTLRTILEDPNVSKVGVHIQGDCTRLKKYLDVQVRGIFELSHLYKQVKYTAAKTPKLINKVAVALSTQVHDILKLPLFKGDVVRSSNWMKRLYYKQVLYSASDAYAGIQLYHVLDAKRKRLNPCPSKPHHAELGLPIPVVGTESKPEEETGHLPGGSSSSSSSSSSFRSELETELLAFPPIPAKPPVRDARILAAEKKAIEYRKSKTSAVSAPPTSLRAYFVWHNNLDLNPEAVAQLLRDPPLKTNTVVSYILDVIVSEKMAYDRGRLESEVLPLLDQRAVQVGSRYGALVRSCERTDEVT